MSILSMSDEEVMALSPVERDALMAAEPTPEPVVEEEEKPEVQEPVVQEPQVEEEEQQEEQEDPTTVVETEEKEETPEVKPDAAKPVKETPAKADAVATDKEAAAATDKEKPQEPAEAGKAKPEEELAKLFSKFKASGRDFQVNSVEEAIQLMQKGVNYHDKMHGLKPLMGIGRMLERAGLMDETKLSYLIDLHNKKPEAIAKLVKDSGVDTLEVDEAKVAAYKPESKGLTAEENALEDALSDLKQYDSHDRVIKMVNTGLDSASRKTVLSNPSVMLHFADQMQSGVYDVIKAELDKQRILGNLKGMSDLQAYDLIGTELNAKGAFDHLGQPKQQQQEIAPVVVAPRTPAPKPNASAKKAAAPAKATQAPKQAPKEFNPLAMSDEEFLKLAGKPL